MTAHFIFLVGENPQIGPSMGAAQQHETRGLVLRIVAPGLALIYLALKQFARASGTPPLQAHERQIQAGVHAGVQDVLVVARLRRDLAAIGDERDPVAGQILSKSEW